MSEELISGQQAGQPEIIPAEASQQGQPAIENESPQYVTTQQFEDFRKDILKQSESIAQSLVDKKGNAINAKIEQLKAAGITATPEQARALVEREEQQVQSSDHQQEAAQPNAGVGQVDQNIGEPLEENQQNPFYDAMTAISADADGIVIEKDNPEYEMMKQEFSDGPTMVATYARAIAEKRLRLAEDNSNYASAPSLFAAGKKSTVIPKGMSGSDIITRGLTERRR